VLLIGKQADILCTLCEGCPSTSETPEDELIPNMKSPITLSYKDVNVTLRPWSPCTCVLAAAVHNGFIHFPIQSGSCVFTIGCGLHTLGHVADIVGATG